MNNRRPSRKLSLRKKIAFATVTTLVFFALLELVLAGLGIHPQSSTTDRTAGFSSYSPLFVESTDVDGQLLMKTAEGKLHWFNQQSFPKLKAAGTQRVFCMGGSTTYGHPYWDETSFAGWLRQYLPMIDSQHKWEVINAGGISYGSYRVAALMEELAHYQPDMFVIYCAHNEFLERRTYSQMFDQPAVIRHLTALMSRTRIGTLADKIVQSARGQLRAAAASQAKLLPAEVDEELNHTVGPVDYHRDDAWHAQVVADYESNLHRMLAIAAGCGAKIVFVMPAANEKDCSPFKSETSPLTDSTIQQLETHFSQGDQALADLQFESAEAAYRRALELDERNADTHYRLGRALLQQANLDQAFREFRRAIDEDLCPLRATTEIELSIRRVAQADAVPLVDFQARLRRWTQAQSGSTILGDEQFLDHVHPTIEVNRLMAVWIIEELQQQKLVGGKSITDAERQIELEEIRAKVVGAIDQEDEVFAIRNLAKVLHWSGKFAEAIPRARDVLELAPRDPESRYIVACCLANLGQVEEALEEYDLLFADGIGYPRAYLPYGELLAASGQYEQAKAYLLLAILRSPNSATIYESLAEVHLALGEKKFAEEAIEKAGQLRGEANER